MKKKILTYILGAYLVILSIISLAPIAIMLLDSFKTGSELAVNSWGLPKDFTLYNYSSLISYNSGIMIRTFMNSVFVSTVYTALSLLLACLAAYAFAKFQFRGKNVIFALLLATMMVPTELTMPAVYLMFSKVKMLNTYSIQIFPGIANMFCLFMLRQTIETIPSSLLEAAKLDGASHLSIFGRIVLPLSKPSLGALAILTFLSKWNDYIWPHTLLTKQDVMPIMVILPTLNTSSSVWAIPWELVLAGCVVITLPLLIVFLMFQEQFMSSVTIGAVKE